MPRESRRESKASGKNTSRRKSKKTRPIHEGPNCTFVSREATTFEIFQRGPRQLKPNRASLVILGAKRNRRSFFSSQIKRRGPREKVAISNRLPRFRIRVHSGRVCHRSQLFLKTGSGFFVLDPVGTFQKLRFEDLGVFVRIVIFLFLLTIVFLLSFSRPPRGYVRTKKLLHTFNPEPILSLAPGVGFEPTRA